MSPFIFGLSSFHLKNLLEINPCRTMLKTYPAFFLASLFLVLMAKTAQAQSTVPTFSEKVATILYKNCTVCHRSGGIGPFTLENYEDAQSNGLAIKSAVQSGYMPPWPPDTSYSKFSHQRVLSQQQIQDLLSWVDGGMPQGNPALEPAVPVFPGLSELSQAPSARYRIPAYTITSNQDDYRAFVIPSLLDSNKAVTEIQFYPGNKQIVHHILLYYDTSGVCQQLDDADPLPGYSAFGGIGITLPKQVGGWVPGSPALKLPFPFGIPAYKNGKYVMQVHYAPGSAGQTDTSAFELIYKPIVPGMREVFQIPILNHFTSLVNGPLLLQPNQKKTFVEVQSMPIPISVLGLTPHMHLIGRNKTVYGINGTDTLKLIRIKDWNFNWQGQYMYPKLKVLPAGTVLRAISEYDNTVNNPFNPSDPPIQVSAGESTLEEMMMTFFMFVPYVDGDENVILDSTQLLTETRKQLGRQQMEWRLFPNPAGERLFLLPDIRSSLAPVRARIWSAQGKKLKEQTLQPGDLQRFGVYEVDVKDLPAGIYRLSLEGKEGLHTLSFQRK